MHSLAHERKIEQYHRMTDNENSEAWKTRALELGKQLKDQLGERKYYEFVGLMEDDKSWKYYHDFMRAFLDDDDELRYGWGEQDWIGIQ